LRELNFRGLPWHLRSFLSFFGTKRITKRIFDKEIRFPTQHKFNGKLDSVFPLAEISLAFCILFPRRNAVERPFKHIKERRQGNKNERTGKGSIKNKRKEGKRPRYSS